MRKLNNLATLRTAARKVSVLACGAHSIAIFDDKDETEEVAIERYQIQSGRTVNKDRDEIKWIRISFA